MYSIYITEYISILEQIFIAVEKNQIETKAAKMQERELHFIVAIKQAIVLTICYEYIGILLIHIFIHYYIFINLFIILHILINVFI